MSDALDIAFDELADALDKCGKAFERDDLGEKARCRKYLKDAIDDVRHFSANR